MSNGQDFGAVDIAGPRHTPPSGTTSPSEDLINEKIKKARAGRIFAWVFLGTLGAAAITCLCFSLYIACHFLSILEDNTNREMAPEQAARLSSDIKPDNKIAAGLKSETQEKPAEVRAESLEVMSIRVFAPLIPASFSTALALIFFITMARFVTNYNNATKEDEVGQQDYGAIAALVEEIGKVVRTLRGKD